MGIEDQRFRFSQAAAAIGITEAGLRNWLTRNKVDLFGDRPKGGWRTFSRNDIVVLAVAAQLVRFNAPVSQAVTAARHGLADMNFVTFENIPTYVWAAPTKFGEWEISREEAFMWHLGAESTILKISVSETISAALDRLQVD